MKRSDQAKIRSGMKIPLFQPGRSGPQLSSASDMNVPLRALNALLNPQIVRGHGDEVTITDLGMTIQIAVDPVGGGGGSGGTSGMYLLKSVQSDYVTLHTWDGTTEGSTDIYAAKEYPLRNSITSEVIYGVTHNYTYSAGPDSLNVKRTDDNGDGNPEDQYVTRPWVQDEVVNAISASTGVLDGSSNPINLLLIGSRQWAAPLTA